MIGVANRHGGKTMAQMGFFDLSDRYASLDAKRDPLVGIDAVVPWEEFRPTLERVWRKPEAERKSRAGRKPMDAVLMFKTLVLSALYNLSDDQIEYQVRDRASWLTVEPGPSRMIETPCRGIVSAPGQAGRDHRREENPGHRDAAGLLPASEPYPAAVRRAGSATPDMTQTLRRAHPETATPKAPDDTAVRRENPDADHARARHGTRAQNIASRPMTQVS